MRQYRQLNLYLPDVQLSHFFLFKTRGSSGMSQWFLDFYKELVEPGDIGDILKMIK